MNFPSSECPHCSARLYAVDGLARRSRRCGNEPRPTVLRFAMTGIAIPLFWLLLYRTRSVAEYYAAVARSQRNAAS